LKYLYLLGRYTDLILITLILILFNNINLVFIASKVFYNLMWNDFNRICFCIFPQSWIVRSSLLYLLFWLKELGVVFLNRLYFRLYFWLDKSCLLFLQMFFNFIVFNLDCSEKLDYGIHHRDFLDDCLYLEPTPICDFFLLAFLWWL